MSILPENRPEMAEAYAGHPAAVEAAASLLDPARGLRPTRSSRLPVPSRPARAVTLNARVNGFLAYRQSQLAAQGQPVTVAESSRLAFRSLLGVRAVPFGFALNMEFVYQSPRAGGLAYVLTGYTTGYDDGRLTGHAWARECSCPDFQKRRGPARDQLAGDTRCCKHMRLFLALAYLWQGQIAWVGGVPAEHQAAGEGWTIQPF